MSQRPLLTTAEVAKLTGRDRSTITRWVQAERLSPAHRTPAGMLLFDPADVERLTAELASDAEVSA